MSTVFNMVTEIISAADFNLIQHRNILNDFEKTDHLNSNRIIKIYAAKMAAVKCLRMENIDEILLQKLTLLHEENGAPYLSFTEEIKQKLRSFNIQRHYLSITDNEQYVMATVCMLT